MISRHMAATAIRVKANQLVGHATDWQILFVARYAKIVYDQTAMDLDTLNEYDLRMLAQWMMDQ